MQEITLPAHIERLGEVIGFIENAMRDAALDKKQRINVNIAVEEIFVNIARYAYTSGEGDVTISVSADENKITIEFSDGGTPYNPLDKPDPDTSLSADEREIGGLGIFMVKQMMDGMRYRYENGRNILIIEIHMLRKDISLQKHSNGLGD
jgi:sigma-B regulation protein RsbU (phosphoserine phosphatase)